MATPRYTFLPWIRYGIGNEIDEPDNLGAGGPGALTRATLSVTTSVKYRAPGESTDAPERLTVPRTVQLVGPADIVNLKTDAIIRVEPVPHTVDFPASELAYVEFFDEDLPWRYSPARAVGNKLRPWIALIVLAEGEYKVLPPRGELPSVVRLEGNVVLPPVDETWAWAHVQIARDIAEADVEALLRDRPDLGLSRVVCPRRLVPATSYRAFLVPAFETGRRAGLGLASPATPAQQPSWGAAHADRKGEYPIYFEWAFQTVADGDFEALAMRLAPMVAGQELGKRPMDISAPGYGLNGSAPMARVELEGALAPTELVRTAFPVHPGATFVDALEDVLDLSANAAAPQFVPPIEHPFHGANVVDDPIVVPPTYGLVHGGARRLADATSAADLAWLRELNLDPRNRTAAGLGVQVIQQRQEELMERAWQQLGDLERANQQLREAELALEISSAMFAKHLRGSQAGVSERFMILTSATHGGVQASAGADSVRVAVSSSRVPLAMQAPALRRLGRPHKRWLRTPGRRSTAESEAVSRANLDLQAAPLSAAPARPEPNHSVTTATIAANLSQAAARLAMTPRTVGRMFLELARKVQSDAWGATGAAEANAPAFRQKVLDELAIRVAVPDSEEAGAEANLKDVVNAVPDDGIVVEGKGAMVAIMLPPATFERAYGEGIESKSYRGVRVQVAHAVAPPEPLPPSRMVDAEMVQGYQVALGVVNTTVLTARPGVIERAALDTTALLDQLATTLRPTNALVARVVSRIADLGPRSFSATRPLRPVLWYPTFPDPMFEDLRDLSKDFIIPNFADLPKNTLTLLEPNRRFIHSYLAGLNTELARELLWREFPTDQAGTYFSRFWDMTDAAQPAPDITPMHTWSAALGDNGRTDDFIVLVVRGDLLRRFPNTAVFMCPATTRADGKRVPRYDQALFPSFQGTIDPDVALFGFPVKDTDARGESGNPARPGWFVVLKERPGQLRFGMDDGEPPGGFQTWDDLSWGAAKCAPGTHIVLATVPAPAPVIADGTSWGASAADMACALYQSPVVVARHAAEMLPDPSNP